MATSMFEGTLPVARIRPRFTQFMLVLVTTFGCLGLFSGSGLAQDAKAAADPKAEKAELLKELNRDIWLPFSKSFAEDKAEDFINLHSKDLIRAEGNGKRVLSLAQYAENTRKGVKARIESKGKAEIHFRFLERIVSRELASERGIFEFVGTNAKGETAKFYGKFHVFSRKENGVWKILVDYDSTENKTITEETFKAADALDDFSK